jgi:hypothetical protein
MITSRTRLCRRVLFFALQNIFPTYAPAIFFAGKILHGYNRFGTVFVNYLVEKTMK